MAQERRAREKGAPKEFGEGRMSRHNALSESKNPSVQVSVQTLEEVGAIPNSRLPLLIYRHPVPSNVSDLARFFEKMFGSHDWVDAWRDGIYDYQHFHSTAHEVLGIFRGFAEVEFGGEHGVVEELRRGDVAIIPAGVSHKRI